MVDGDRPPLHASGMIRTLALWMVTGVVAAQDAVPATATATTTVLVRDDTAAERLGWQLGVQAWTFRDRSAFAAIDTAAALGLRYIELFPGQQLAKEHGEARVDPGMAPELRTALLEKLKAAKVTPVAFGVCGFDRDEGKARKLFEFVKAMGMTTITCEPDPDAWDLVEKLAVEYGIDIACHDHPKPSYYWDPATVMAAVAKRHARLGACADTGHWVRSGLGTVASLKVLEGRIRSLHFKDIAPADASGEDKPWGTGGGKARAMLDELRRQKFAGLVSIEYESGAGKELEQNVARCIAWFDEQARAIVAAPAGAERSGHDGR